MAKLYRITPLEKKSINVIFEFYHVDENDNLRWFNVKELYRWGVGFRELDFPVYAEDKVISVDVNLGWGSDLDDLIAVDFEFDDSFTDKEKETIENCWCNGDSNDEYNRTGQAWAMDYADYELEDEYVEIIGPVKVDIIDEDEYNKVLEENIKLPNRPKVSTNIF